MMKQILSTKQLTEQELIHAQSLSLNVKCVEVIRTRAIPFAIPEYASFDSVAFTSANALKHFLEAKDTLALLKQKTIFSISGKTRQTLAALGFHNAVIADNSQQLAVMVAQSAVGAVLHPCSKLKLNDLEIVLSKSAIKYIPLPVYETQFVEVKLETHDFDALLFFSPSGVDSFLKQNVIPEKAVCCCIGATTAAYLESKQVTNQILYPQLPNASAMLSLLASYVKN